MPDEVFAGKVPGDGICILPEDGKVYAPVNGVVESADGHAYGIAAVLLCNGECFTITGTTADSAVRAGRTIVFRYERKNAGGA
jgi:hypothetical protein